MGYDSVVFSAHIDSLIFLANVNVIIYFRYLTHDKLSFYELVLGETMAETEEDEDDPDLLQDSIYHLNLSQYLQDFLLNFSTHHCFPVYIQHLNIPERKVLSSLNINASFMQ